MIAAGTAAVSPGSPVTKNYCTQYICNNASTGTTSLVDAYGEPVYWQSSCAPGFKHATFFQIGCDTGLFNNAGQNATAALKAQKAFLASQPFVQTCHDYCWYSDGTSVAENASVTSAEEAGYQKTGWVHGLRPNGYCLPKYCKSASDGQIYSPPTGGPRAR